MPLRGVVGFRPRGVAKDQGALSHCSGPLETSAPPPALRYCRKVHSVPRPNSMIRPGLWSFQTLYESRAAVRYPIIEHPRNLLRRKLVRCPVHHEVGALHRAEVNRADKWF